MITRRTLLVTATGSAISSLLWATPARAQNIANSGTLKSMVLAAADTASFEFLCQNFSEKRSFAFPQSVSAQIAAVGAVSVTVDFDERIFAAQPTAVISVGDTFTVSETSVSDQPGSISRLSYSVPDLGLAQDTVLLPVSLKTIDSYPSDSNDDVEPIVFTCWGGDGLELATSAWSPSSSGSTVTAWGGELLAGWDAVDVGNDSARQMIYRYPSVLQFKSLGPDSTPPLTKVTVFLDAVAIKSVQFGTVAVDDVIVPSDRYRVNYGGSDGLVAEIQLLDQVTPGSTVSVALSVTPWDSRPTMTTVRYASAYVTATASPSVWMRDTDAYAINDLTSSGSPQVPDSAKGKV